MDEIKGIRIVSLTGEKEYGIEDSEVREELANVVDGAPEELDSFKEAFEKFKEGGEALAGIAADVAAVGKAVADETARAEQAEQTLDNKITAEAERAKEAENKLANTITDESKVTDDKIAAEINKIKDGDTIVGQAREIHSRNGKTVTDSFLIRTTAGSGTIGDGVASLKSVGGNIVKNLVDGTFESGWIHDNTNTSSINKDISTIKSQGVGGVKYTVSPVAGHIYYISAMCKVINGELTFLYGNALVRTTNNDWHSISYRNAVQSASGVFMRNDNPNLSLLAFVRKPLLIDLTDRFGAGNEPDQATCDRLFGTMDALPQGLSIANPATFTSTGFNQSNPDNVLEGKSIVDNAIVSGDKKIAVIPCLPCKVGTGENNGYCIHGEFGEDIKVYLTPLNPMEVDGELYMHELTKDATTDTYVPQIKGYMLVEVPTTANLCAHFLWSEDKCERDTYEPYFESKVELPVIPQMSEWGLAGISSSGTPVCDEIDFERGVYVKRIGSVDLGSLTWRRSTISGVFFAAVNDILSSNAPLGTLGTGGYCINYTTVINNYGSFADIPDKCIVYGSTIDAKVTSIVVQDLAYDNISSFVNSVKGNIAYYILATPEEYPLPKVDNNYISSDYGVEQFDSVVPCNANNLYYMRSLAGETRNFLDRMYDNTAKTDAKEVADYITNGIEGNKELATNAPNLALRALFIAAGAEYNDTDSDITKSVKIPSWTTYGEYINEPVVHKAKCYMVGLVGDLTEEEMLTVYNNGKWWMFADASGFTIRGRANLISKDYVETLYKKYTLNQAVNGNKIMVDLCLIPILVDYNISVSVLNVTGLNFLGQGSSFKRIIGIINMRNVTTAQVINPTKLEYCTLINLCANLDIDSCPNISKDSVKYMIDNAAPKSAITITLHADAYARLANDADVVAALAAQPLITLVSA